MKWLRLIAALSILGLGMPLGAQTISNIKPLTASGTLSAANAGTCSATGTGCVVLMVGGYSSVAVQVTGNASSNTLQFETTLDPTPSASSTWIALSLTPPNSTTSVTSTTSTGIWSGPVNGSAVRVRMSTLVSSTAVVSMRSTFGAIARWPANPINSPLDLVTASGSDQYGLSVINQTAAGTYTKSAYVGADRFGSFFSNTPEVEVAPKEYIYLFDNKVSGGSGTFTLSAFDTHNLSLHAGSIGATTAVLVATGTGNCTAGTHLFTVTVVNGGGESTKAGNSSTVTCDGTHKQVTVTWTTLPYSQATGYNVYATKADGSGPFLVASSPTVATNVGTYTFNIADASFLSTTPPAHDQAQYTVANFDSGTDTTLLNSGTTKTQLLVIKVGDGSTYNEMHFMNQAGQTWNMGFAGSAGSASLRRWYVYNPSGTGAPISADDSLFGYLGGDTSANPTIKVGGGTVEFLPSSTGGSVKANAKIVESFGAITVASGFGTNADAAFVTGSTPAAFDLNTGTGGSPTSGVITLPANGGTGWICAVWDATTAADVTRQTAYTASSATFTTTVAWGANQHLFGSCHGF